MAPVYDQEACYGSGFCSAEITGGGLLGPFDVDLPVFQVPVATSLGMSHANAAAASVGNVEIDLTSGGSATAVAAGNSAPVVFDGCCVVVTAVVVALADANSAGLAAADAAVGGWKAHALMQHTTV